MNTEIYSNSLIEKYMDENLYFKDEKLKKYFTRNLQRDLGKFRDRVHKYHSDKSFEKMMYVLVTDSIRDIILETIGELTEYMKNMGDLIISGGEAFNLYATYHNRIITSDIDAKFVPRLSVNPKFFGKLQAIKLLLWDKLGEISKKLNTRIKKRIISTKAKHPKLFKFLGISFKNSGPFVTRRYTLIKKKKLRNDNKPGKGDVFIDVELFAIDLNIRYFSIESGRIKDFTIGGILDIPFMRPKEFGYEVALSKQKGITYRNIDTGKLITNNKVFVASKEFLIEDIYLMHKLKLRPEKKEKDRQRLVKLAQMFDKRVKSSESMDSVFKHIKPKLMKIKPRFTGEKVIVPMKKASRVNPYNYKNFTTEPSKDKISKQLVYGLDPVVKTTKVNGYVNSNGNKRFNLKNFKWKNVNNQSYVKNEFKLRPINSLKLPNNFNITKTLYGYNPNRNKWVSKKLLNKSAAIPFVGLKK